MIAAERVVGASNGFVIEKVKALRRYGGEEISKESCEKR